MAQTTWTPEEIAIYRANARRLREQDRELEHSRRERAWEVAHAVADLLRSKFGVTRVVVFGSLARTGSFTRWSDVDIAAWGINPRDTLRAIGVAMDIDDEIEVNLVDVDIASSSLLTSIERDGIDI